MFIRFVVGTNKDSPRHQTGVVTELRLLRDSGELPIYVVEQINEIFQLMNDSYDCPPFDENDWSPNAISWFKDSAQDLVFMFREIVLILEEYGRPVRMLKTDDPGVIIYEDSVQIVAESSDF